jgi:hypothetical protein
VVEQRARRVALLQLRVAQHGDAMAERHRLRLVVGDVDRGDAEPPCSSAMSARICTRSLASRLESGSSIRKTWGWRMIARPIATRWRWPPESCPGLRFEARGELELLRDLRTRSSRSGLGTAGHRKGKPMLASTVSYG